MGSLFGKPKTPAAPKPTPSVATPAVEAAAEAERRRYRQASGRAATILTEGQSGGGSANIGTTKLLGG
jgi:hypothetical protein